MTSQYEQADGAGDGTLEEAVARIVAAGDPLQVILFGSRARGDAHSDSDYDFLVIEESAPPCYRRAAKYRRALSGLLPAKDILVWTPAEAAEWSTQDNFVQSAAFESLLKLSGMSYSECRHIMAQVEAGTLAVTSDSLESLVGKKSYDLVRSR